MYRLKTGIKFLFSFYKSPTLSLQQKKLLNLYRYQVEQVAANALRSSGVNGYRAMGLAIFICVLYAINDEIHQLFMPRRGGQVKDVIIDSVGAIVGVLGYKIIRAWFCRLW